jgi:hypothetical protein
MFIEVNARTSIYICIMTLKKIYHHAHDVKVNLDTVYFPSKLR